MDVPAHRPEPIAESLRWDRIMAWQVRLADNLAGRSIAAQHQPDGVSIGGQAVSSENVGAFVAMLHDGDVVAGFDWPGWMEQRGRELAADRELIHGAYLEDCRRWLAAVVRADRVKMARCSARSMTASSPRYSGASRD